MIHNGCKPFPRTQRMFFDTPKCPEQILRNFWKVERKNAALFLLQSIFCMNRELSENWKIVEYSFYISHCASFWIEKRPNIFDLDKTWVRKFSVPHINICYIFTSNWDNLKHPSCTACRFCKLISHAKLKTTAKHSNDL